MFSGLTISKKMMFHVIIPSEKKRIAAPETLLRSFGNCDQRQFKIGMELSAKQVIGTSKKKKAKVKKFSAKLRKRGAIVKITAEVRMTVL